MKLVMTVLVVPFVHKIAPQMPSGSVPMKNMKSSRINASNVTVAGRYALLMR
jgi:hypothetical protein